MKKFFIHIYGIIRVGWYIVTKKWSRLEGFCKNFINKFLIEKSFYYWSLAKALQKQEKFTEAVSCYKKIIAISKRPHPYDYFDLVRALYEGKIYNEIPEYCIFLLKGNFGRLDSFARKCILEQIYWYLAYSYYNLNQLQEAIPWLKKLLNYKGKEDHYLPLAYCYQRTGNYKEAIYYYEKALNSGIKKEKKENIYKNLGVCYSEINEIDKAIKMYKALELKEDINVREEIASLYLKAEELEKAEEYIDKVIEVNPNKRAYCIKGMICLGKDKKEEAKKFIKMALEKDPEDEFLNELYDKIKD